MAFLGDNAIEMEPVETDDGLAALAPLVLSQLPACPDLLVRQQLGHALREFCRETDACICEQRFAARDGRPCPEDGATVFFVGAVPSGMTLGTVLAVEVNGRDARFDAGDAPAVRVPRWLSPDDRVRIRFSVVPRAGGESCPRWFIDRHAEAIAAGAMFHLLSMTGRGWSDAARAAQFAAEYHGAIGDAAHRRLESLSHGAPSAIPCGGLFM